MRKSTSIIAVTLFFVGMLGVSINFGSDSNQESLFLADSTPSIGETARVFFACRTPKDEKWTYSQGYSTIKCGADSYLAYGEGGVVKSPAFKVGAHKGITVSFKLAFIDSWDGESFLVKADGATIYTKTWHQDKSKTDSCQNGWNDAYDTVTIGFNHTASKVAFVFRSTLDQEKKDEAWGICDFTVTSSQDPVTAAGARIPTIDANPRTWFVGSNMIKDDTWTYNHGYNTISCAGNTYLGHYGAKASVSSPKFLVNSAHQGIIVSFKLALIDSWDDESFQVKADGVTVYSLAHICPSGPGQGTNTCVRQDAGWNDVYKTITFGFNHTASKVSFVITSTLDQEKDDESWGISDFTVTLAQSQVDSTGRLIKVLDDKPSTFFSCAGPVNDEQWTYNHGFNTIKCAGKTFVGHYGSGAQVTSFAFAAGAHKGIIVSFKLALIDSWDGESFQVKADGVTVYNLAHVCPSGPGQGTNTCVRQDAGWNDVYKTITFGFNHTASTVSFVITSTLDQEKDDESWGVCDFTITLAQSQVDSTGRLIIVPTHSTWKIVPGLMDSSLISFESTILPGHYLRHSGSKIHLHRNDGSNLFKQDATFRVIQGLANTALVTFESYNYPKHYIRHQNSEFYIHKSDGSDLFKKDATFKMAPGTNDQYPKSIESLNYPGYYLTFFQGQVALKKTA